MKNFLQKYKYPIIGVLVLIILFFWLKGCDNKTIKLEEIPEPEAIINIEDSLASYYAIDVPLFPQKGEKSCWAASISMMDSLDYFNLNKEKANPIWSDSLASQLYNDDRKYKLQRQILNNKNELSWTRLKKALLKDKAMVAYKYFDISESYKNAHVFIIKGYQEIGETKWVLVNDPWPVNNGKQTALAFNNFIRPKIDTVKYTDISYNYTSNSNDKRSEPDFSIFSSEGLQSNKIETYKPDIQPFTKNKRSRIKPKQIEGLLARQLLLFHKANPELYKKLNIDFVPQQDNLTIDISSFLNVLEFKTVASFVNYDLSKSQDSDYLFDGDQLAFVNGNKNKEPDISLTVELEDKVSKPYLYVSRFEAYKYSFKKDWDVIVNDVGIALEHASIRNFLFGISQVGVSTLKYNYKSTPSKVKQAGFLPSFGENDITENSESQSNLHDVAMLALYGGPVYSFTLEGYDEKIVADPYNQLNFKANRKPLFTGISGTHYYRLSSIIVPKRYEFVDKERAMIEEWRIQNVSDNGTKPITGINNPEISISKPDPEVPGSKPTDTRPTDTRPITDKPDGIDATKPAIVLESIFSPEKVIKVLDQEVSYDGKAIRIKVYPIFKEETGETKIKNAIKEILTQRGTKLYGNDKETMRKLELVINSAPIIIETSKENPVLEEAKSKVNKLFDRLLKDPAPK